MAYASYERQHLALWAAAYINAAGTTLIAFGCSMVKAATANAADGKYYLSLGAGDGLVPDEIFCFVQPRTTAPRFAVQSDQDNLTKEINVFNDTATSLACDIEVAVYRSVTK